MSTEKKSFPSSLPRQPESTSQSMPRSMSHQPDKEAPSPSERAEGEVPRGLPLLRRLNGRKKFQYLLDYYKLPLILALILIYIIAWLTVKHLTSKDVILYAALVNVAPPEDLISELSDGYLKKTGKSASEESVYLYRNLFLSADAASEYHPYSYATKMKILGAIDDEKLDLVLMNREAFDAFSQNGYLEDLSKLLNGPGASKDFQDLYAAIKDSLCTNILIKEDNSVDVLLGNESEYQSVTEEGFFGLNLTEVSPVIQKAELTGTVYLGIISNSKRKEEALQYLAYLIQGRYDTCKETEKNG